MTNSLGNPIIRAWNAHPEYQTLALISLCASQSNAIQMILKTLRRKHRRNRCRDICFKIIGWRPWKNVVGDPNCERNHNKTKER